MTATPVATLAGLRRVTPGLWVMLGAVPASLTNGSRDVDHPLGAEDSVVSRGT
jgi:hypothetical protein